MSTEHNFYAVRAFRFVTFIALISGSYLEVLGSNLPLVSCFTTDMSVHKSNVEFTPVLKDICILKAPIELNQTHPYFRFGRHINGINFNPLNQTVPSIAFQDFTMHTFTNDTCDTFPNTTILDVSNLNLRAILQTAFRNCSELREIHLMNNNLTNISEGTFSNLSKLESIDLGGNEIVALEANSFSNCKSLCKLVLMQNQLKQFPVEAIGKQDNLQLINLSDNYLEDVDVEEISKSCKKLSWLGLCKDPPMDEEKYTRIKEEFEQKNVSIHCFPFVGDWHLGYGLESLHQVRLLKFI